MNRTEFMNQLEILLQNISFAEKEEALQYYNDYFDDAGAENEQSVIEALGNPARVAENIRRELSENQGIKSITAADRAVVEYGKADIDEEAVEMPVAEAAEGHMVEMSVATSEIRKSADTADCGSSGPGRSGFPEGSSGSGGSGGFGGSPGSSGKGGMSGGMTVLIAVLVVFASPFILGLLGIMFGLLAMWFALIFSFGVVVLSMFIVLFTLLVMGGMCIPVDPLVGLALIGGGLICGGLGILFLMLTVAMAGIATPAIFRGIGHIFRFGKKKVIA